jgi:hypothetical protein
MRFEADIAPLPDTMHSLKTTINRHVSSRKGPSHHRRGAIVVGSEAGAVALPGRARAGFAKCQNRSQTGNDVESTNHEHDVFSATAGRDDR